MRLEQHSQIQSGPQRAGQEKGVGIWLSRHRQPHVWSGTSGLVRVTSHKGNLLCCWTPCGFPTSEGRRALWQHNGSSMSPTSYSPGSFVLGHQELVKQMMGQTMATCFPRPWYPHEGLQPQSASENENSFLGSGPCTVAHMAVVPSQWLDLTSCD